MEAEENEDCNDTAPTHNEAEGLDTVSNDEQMQDIACEAPAEKQTASPETSSTGNADV